jgi:hypothetical protein|tara:strand:- start:2873 stop:4231 length:1359 start_codon:yes stop_codon:yes gene_type:complete
MNKETLMNNLSKYGKIIGGCVFATIVALNSFTTVGSGEAVRIQNNITGGYSWKLDEGIALKVPFFSRVVTYSQEGTVAVTDNQELCEASSICASPRQVGFADTYGITIEASFRYSLSKNVEVLEQMHDKVKNSENLFGNTLLPFSQDLINYTASQFKAENFLQGAQNQFKSRLVDQASNGMLVTKRTKELVTSEVADRNTDRDNTKVGQQFRYEIKILEDEKGLPLRNPTAIAAYGITVVPAGINLVDYDPEPRLREFMVDKQDRVRARAKIVEDQENERQLAITAQLKGERERIQKQNVLLQQKDAAKIAGEKEVLQAELQAQRETVERKKVAELAIIDKQRELQIARANEGIQSANAKAAKFEAQAIKEKGFAEAEVDRAKLKAKQDNKDIYLAELDRDIQVKMAEVLPQVKITSPQIVMGGSGTSGSQVSDLLSTKLVQDVINNSKTNK